MTCRNAVCELAVETLLESWRWSDDGDGGHVAARFASGETPSGPTGHEGRLGDEPRRFCIPLQLLPVKRLCMQF